MTLGGLALAVGILVDDATVTIENIERYLEEGYDLHGGHSRRRDADRDAGTGLHLVHLHRVSADVLPERRVALPVRAAGRGGYLCHACLVHSVADPGADDGDVSAEDRTIIRRRLRAMCLARFQRWFERGFEKMRDGYQDLLKRLVRARAVFLPVFLLLCLYHVAAGVLTLGRTSFQARTMDRSFFTCVRPPARVSKRRRGCAI